MGKPFYSRIRVALATVVAFGCGCDFPGTSTTFFCHGLIRPPGIGGKLRSSRSVVICNMGRKKFDVISKQDGKLLIEDATTTKKSCIPVVFNESVHNIKTVSSVQPWVDDVNRWIVGTLKNGFDIFFHNRDYARFYALEKIARSPYMGYVFVLHFMEMLGLSSHAEYMRLHFSESDNELHHLKIMEELGGNSSLLDCLLSQSIAFSYYWVVVFLYLLSPSTAYNLNQHIEEHAYDTYDDFLKKNADMLAQEPAPICAHQYYSNSKLYPLNELKGTNMDIDPARPKVETLYDVFCCIRDDEGRHAKVMKELQEELPSHFQKTR